MKQFKLCQNKILRKNGQGLIEVLVSLALLIVGILGSLTLATITIRAGTESRERVQAALLAQEGIERIKNIRDTNWIKNRNWNTSFPTSSSSSSYKVSKYISDLEGWQLELGGENGIQGMFTRTITFPAVGTDKITVNCIVSWTDASGKHSVTAIDYITNWQKQE